MAMALGKGERMALIPSLADAKDLFAVVRGGACAPQATGWPTPWWPEAAPRHGPGGQGGLHKLGPCFRTFRCPCRRPCACTSCAPSWAVNMAASAQRRATCICRRRRSQVAAAAGGRRWRGADPARLARRGAHGCRPEVAGARAAGHPPDRSGRRGTRRLRTRSRVRSAWPSRPITLTHLGQVFAWFRQRYPRVSVELADGLMSRVIPQLRESTLDLAVVAKQGDLPQSGPTTASSSSCTSTSLCDRNTCARQPHSRGAVAAGMGADRPATGSRACTCALSSGRLAWRHRSRSPMPKPWRWR